MAGGTVGGVLGMTFVYPLDTVKCRLQTAPPSQYGGMSHALAQMIRHEGSLSIYRGLLSPVVGYGAIFAASFSAYRQAGNLLLEQRGARIGDELSLQEASLAGLWAGIIQAPLRQVFERVKGVMQVKRGEMGRSPYRWSGACAADLVRTEGIKMGLFRGMGSTLIRESVQFAIYYPMYEFVKRQLIRRNGAGPGGGNTVLSPFLLMAAGGIAGTAQWLPPVYFLDVIKTRMQTAEGGVYRGAWDCAVKTFRSEGSSAFFRGLGPSILRAFPLHAVIFLGYELTTDFLAKPEVSQPMCSRIPSAAPSAARAVGVVGAAAAATAANASAATAAAASAASAAAAATASAVASAVEAT
ncbi:unnamed protein product [Choristocarpus tenellus]